MKIYRLICILAFALAGITVMAQEVEKTSEPVEIDYDLPQKYIVAGVSVEGNHYFNAQQIISLSGLQKGMEVTVPSDDLSSIVSRLWMQRYFEDIALEIDHFSENRDSAYFRIRIQERPRVSRWLFSGVKKGEKKELEEKGMTMIPYENAFYDEILALPAVQDLYKDIDGKVGGLGTTLQEELAK